MQTPHTFQWQCLWSQQDLIETTGHKTLPTSDEKSPKQIATLAAVRQIHGFEISGGNLPTSMRRILRGKTPIYTHMKIKLYTEESHRLQPSQNQTTHPELYTTCTFISHCRLWQSWQSRCWHLRRRRSFRCNHRARGFSRPRMMWIEEGLRIRWKLARNSLNW